MASTKSDLPEKILKYIDEIGDVDTLDAATHFKEDHQKIIGAVKSLQAVDDLITAEPRSNIKWELTKEGEQVAANGSHEALVWKAVLPEGIPQPALMKLVPNPVGFSKAMSNGWILINKVDGTPIVHRKATEIVDDVQKQLGYLLTNQSSLLTDQQKKDFKKRKLMQEVTTKSFFLGKGPNFTVALSKPKTDLTADMLASGSWKTCEFKPYNFAAMGVQLDAGHLHPLLKVREDFRQIFLEMGFSEMATNNYIESSFWNFDALFQPQQHPARDAHDTFFVSTPAETTEFPEKYLDRVKKVHSRGGYGSQGYGYDWKRSEAQKNLLRTHTTAVSARTLYELANREGGFTPVKYFSIDRVFRNETLDATHLAEFHQVEGVVADYDLNLGNLIGVLKAFFAKLGLTQLKFKPAYNPYTEPSMEIFCYHPGLAKWIEVGNSGMFRPEMLLPMGLPPNVHVIAWGLSLERPTMIKYGINNIRDLVGPKVDLQMVKNNPICRLEKV